MKGKSNGKTTTAAKRGRPAGKRNTTNATPARKSAQAVRRTAKQTVRRTRKPVESRTSTPNAKRGHPAAGYFNSVFEGDEFSFEKTPIAGRWTRDQVIATIVIFGFVFLLGLVIGMGIGR